MDIPGVSSPSNAPLVTIKNGATVTNSRDVAAYFGKEHFNILQDIDGIVADAPDTELFFQFCPYKANDKGRSYRSFDMSRDGFTLLAMGFTGKKALTFKLKHIEQFNRMEEELKQRIGVAVESGTFSAAEVA